MRPLRRPWRLNDAARLTHVAGRPAIGQSTCGARRRRLQFATPKATIAGEPWLLPARHAMVGNWNGAMGFIDEQVLSHRVSGLADDVRRHDDGTLPTNFWVLNELRAFPSRITRPATAILSTRRRKW